MWTARAWPCSATVPAVTWPRKLRNRLLHAQFQDRPCACCASAWPAAYESEAHGRPGSRGIDGGHCRISLPRRRYGPQYRTRDCRLRGGMVRLLARAMAYEAIRWKCTISSLPAYQSIVVCAARSLTALMPSCCFGYCSLGCEASRAFVRWFQFPTRLMRMPDGVFANGQNLSQSASV